MIKMRMGEEEIGVERLLALEVEAERPKAGAAIEDQQPAAAAHLDTGGVAAIPRELRTGTGDAAAHPPEPDSELVPAGHRLIPSTRQSM